MQLFYLYFKATVSAHASLVCHCSLWFYCLTSYN